MAYENLRFEVADGVGTITFDRPKVLNAMNAATFVELASVLDGGLDSLNGAQMVVVPEPYFNHPTLQKLGFLDRIHVAWRFGSGTGYDYEFYAVPQR